jgi:hypothetical protein
MLLLLGGRYTLGGCLLLRYCLHKLLLLLLLGPFNGTVLQLLLLLLLLGLIIAAEWYMPARLARTPVSPRPFQPPGCSTPSHSRQLHSW